CLERLDLAAYQWVRLAEPPASCTPLAPAFETLGTTLHQNALVAVASVVEECCSQVICLLMMPHSPESQVLRLAGSLEPTPDLIAVEMDCQNSQGKLVPLSPETKHREQWLW